MNLHDLKVRIYADGARVSDIRNLTNNPLISGFTTNPSLMKSAGITDYESSARELILATGGRPISFEVFADDIADMERQARIISSWGENVFVKIPVTNTKSASTVDLIRVLHEDGVRLNITAIMTSAQVQKVAAALNGSTDSIVSVFAGRIADTGIDPTTIMEESRQHLRESGRAWLLWASTREVLNIFQADAIGCDIITVTPDILAKLPIVGKDLMEYSSETVFNFYDDAQQSGYRL